MAGSGGGGSETAMAGARPSCTSSAPCSLAISIFR